MRELFKRKNSAGSELRAPLLKTVEACLCLWQNHGGQPCYWKNWACFGCGKVGHKVKDCPSHKGFSQTRTRKLMGECFSILRVASKFVVTCTLRRVFVSIESSIKYSKPLTCLPLCTSVNRLSFTHCFVSLWAACSMWYHLKPKVVKHPSMIPFGDSLVAISDYRSSVRGLVRISYWLSAFWHWIITHLCWILTLSLFREEYLSFGFYDRLSVTIPWVLGRY